MQPNSDMKNLPGREAFVAIIIIYKRIWKLFLCGTKIALDLEGNSNYRFIVSLIDTVIAGHVPREFFQVFGTSSGTEGLHVYRL